jgi:putative ABC transport system permease protein
MSIRALITRLRALHRRSAIDAELAEEIEEHLHLEEQANVERGMAPADARAAARRAFGNPTLVRESSTEAWRWLSLDTLLTDLRIGGRLALKHRVSTVVAITSLGVGIGITSAVLSRLHAVTHPPFAYSEPSRLVFPWAKSVRKPGFDEMQISLHELQAWQHDATRIQLAGFSWTQSVNVAAGAAPTRGLASMVTTNLLDVLGVAPKFGRAFTSDDGRDDAPNTVIVSYDFWKENLGGSTAALTTPITIDREPHAVIGVMPPDFRLPLLRNVKLLLPARRAPWVYDRSARSIVPVGRLTPGATPESAGDELARLSSAFHADSPDDRGAWTLNVQLLTETGAWAAVRMLKIFLALSVVVLIIACANVAILLLARVPARRHELIVRLALGAERRRLLAQLSTETLWLAAGATVVAILVMLPTSALLHRMIEGMLSFDIDRSFHLGALVYPLSIAVATVFVFGVAPALSALRALRDPSALAGRRDGGAVEKHRLRRVLIAAEVALSIVLAVGGWLMVESVLAVHARPLGFEPTELVTARVLLDTARYRTPAAQTAFYAMLTERLRAHGELRDVSAASAMPLAPSGELSNYVTRAPVRASDRVDTVTASMTIIAPGYFDAMHIPVVAGAVTDASESEPIAVVNEAFASKFWPGQNAVGQQLRVLVPMYTDGEAVTPGSRRVVAVVRNVRPSPTHHEDSWPGVFIPHRQNPVRAMYVAVRAPTPAAGAAAIRAEVAQLDPILPIFSVKSIDELMDYWLAALHLDALVLDVLAGVGALLTLVGIYSVMTVFVSQRTREIGIRIAVGARRRHVVAIVVGQTLAPVVAGTIAGTIAALLGSRTIQSLLNGVSPLEPRAFLAAGLLIGLVVLIASSIPATRATRLDPLEALRAE